MDNEYILVINAEEQTKKILEKSYKENEYQIFNTSENGIILAKKVFNKDLKYDEKIEEKVLKLVVTIARKYPVKGIITLNMSKEINTIIEEVEENKDQEKYFKLGNHATWRIRQAITKAIVNKYNSEENSNGKNN